MPHTGGMMRSETRLAIGCMTGTSMDGLDVVLVESDGRGLEISARVRAGVAVELGLLGDRLRSYATGTPMPAEDVARMSRDLGERHRDAIADLLKAEGVERPDLCVLPGQTVFHAPPLSMQLIEPWAVFHRFGCAVAYDLRSADIAAGGQGAPITALADWVLFRSADHARTIVNLGGFCNITVLGAGCTPEAIIGRDVCSCNQILDRAARAVLDRPFDAGGSCAMRGAVDRGASDALRALLGGQAAGGRSLGTGDEAFAWIDRYAGTLPAGDLLASASDAIGVCIGEAVGGDGEIVLAGGGVHHRALVAAIDRGAGAQTMTTETLGVGTQEREAACIAVLGLLAADGVDITLAQVTGRNTVMRAGCAWIGAMG